MARRGNGPALQVRSAFEAARIAPQCLADIYERLVPIPRWRMRPATHSEPPPDLAVAVDRLGRRRAERG
jgi:hypothetical protein